jgi:hypothetical protein
MHSLGREDKKNNKKAHKRVAQFCLQHLSAGPTTEEEHAFPLTERNSGQMDFMGLTQTKAFIELGPLSTEGL